MALRRLDTSVGQQMTRVGPAPCSSSAGPTRNIYWEECPGKDDRGHIEDAGNDEEEDSDPEELCRPREEMHLDEKTNRRSWQEFQQPNRAMNTSRDFHDATMEEENSLSIATHLHQQVQRRTASDCPTMTMSSVAVDVEVNLMSIGSLWDVCLGNPPGPTRRVALDPAIGLAAHPHASHPESCFVSTPSRRWMPRTPEFPRPKKSRRPQQEKETRRQTPKGLSVG